ncbi:TetR/AcrR family transcriptional regulator [Bacillus sp. 31A1R]|uniref:TetR/AcrR family transcriptional regulator n=1 Tax=Robertmurraya mangrovi TaxID=3098077 RepID=A0ABU5J2B2_9BACI|nr:TetR/AcrR family transcriptional regulator [Bacillus sp. 31A1R]MDZ5473562.1 TetR/AcrR family transcriptional regulator [Bacillus sp. 31A1R]
MSKKLLIMEKSIELFAENGFESTSVQQITERCGISKGAFYLYFKSKEELITSLIDHFMSSIISDIEQSVRNETQTDKLLYNLLDVLFSTFQKQTNFTKFFIKEQVLTFNQDLFAQLQMYTTIVNKTVLSIIQKQFAYTRQEMHLDLLFTINGFIKSYLELFFIDDYEIDVDQLCKAIVEKVNIIAEHSTIPFITPEYLIKTKMQSAISKEQVMNLLKEAMDEIQEDVIILDSLTLLLDDLTNPTLSEAIRQGLLNNLRTNNSCRWVAYIYDLYIKESSSAGKN